MFGDFTMAEVTVEILGTGCKKCQQLEANAKAAVNELNLDATVNHITDAAEIAQRGVMRTPSLVVNGQIVSSGQVLTKEKIKPLLV
jgi:small redox-active disulfide protein 2